MKLIRCEVCGKEREVYRYGKFCGNACTQRAKRARAKRGRESGHRLRESSAALTEAIAFLDKAMPGWGT